MLSATLILYAHSKQIFYQILKGEKYRQSARLHLILIKAPAMLEVINYAVQQVSLWIMSSSLCNGYCKEWMIPAGDQNTHVHYKSCWHQLCVSMHMKCFLSFWLALWLLDIMFLLYAICILYNGFWVLHCTAALYYYDLL